MAEGPDFDRAGKLPGNQFMMFAVDFGWYVEAGKRFGWCQLNRKFFASVLDPYPVILYGTNWKPAYWIEGSRKAGASIRKPHYNVNVVGSVGILWDDTGILTWSEDDLPTGVDFFMTWMLCVIHFFPPEFLRIVSPNLAFRDSNRRVPTVFESPPRGGDKLMWSRWHKPIQQFVSGRLVDGRPRPGP